MASRGCAGLRWPPRPLRITWQVWIAEGGRIPLQEGSRQVAAFRCNQHDEHRVFKTVTSSQSKEVSISHGDRGVQRDVPVLVIDFKEIGGLPMDARVTALFPASETLSYWSLEVTNRTT